MKELAEIARGIVSNLHQSRIFKAISEYQKKDAFELREELGIASHTESFTDPFELLESVKRHILSKALGEQELVDFLMEVPYWAGFKPESKILETGEQAIITGKRGALANLWIIMLPKIVASPTILPSEIEKQGLETLVENLLKSEASRAELNHFISLELINRGFVEEYFEITGLDSGFTIKESMKNSRLQAMIALMIMKASGCPFDLDKVFNLPEIKLIEETTLYIITMQTQSSLSFQISGSGLSRPFEWPLVGTARVFTRLMSTINVLRRAAARMTTSSQFSSGDRVWTEWEFTSHLIKKISEYYIDQLRKTSGKSKNRELAAFIDILNGENIEITTRVTESNDSALQLYEELSECKRRARIGEKPQISPERRFRVVLSSLKHHLENAQSDVFGTEELIEEIVNVFDAIAEVIGKHIDSLGSQAEKFTEELCFETSFRILEIMNLGTSLCDLPWVSRFIAEEATRLSISQGDMTILSEENRTRRIVSSFAGGVAYLVLQAHQ